MQCELCLNDSRHPFGDTITGRRCRACSKTEKVHPTLFHSLVDRLKNNEKSRYDCLVLLKGTPEDFYVIKKLTDENIYPLCVFVNSYFSSDIAWHNVHTLIHKFDLELRTFNPNPDIYKRLVTYAFRRFLDVLTPYKMLQYSYTQKLASLLEVKYVVTGENQVQTHVRKYTDQYEVHNTPWSVYQHDVHTSKHDFFGPSLDLSYDLVSNYDPLDSISPYGQWYYLSDYITWDQFIQDKAMTQLGARGQFQQTTFDYFQRAGSSIFYEIHDILRYKKYGSIKADDQLSREVRKGTINKKDAQILSTYYKSKLLNFDSLQQHVSGFFSWLGLEQDSAVWFVKNNLKINIEDYEHEIDDSLHNNLVRNLYGTHLGGVQMKKKDFCVYEKGI